LKRPSSASPASISPPPAPSPSPSSPSSSSRPISCSAAGSFSHLAEKPKPPSPPPSPCFFSPSAPSVTSSPAGPFQGPYDVIVDDYIGAGKKIGDTLTILNHPFRISGIVEHGKGGRKFIPIDTMGTLTGTEGKATAFYLKTEHPPKYEDDVRKAILATPGMSQYNVITTDDYLASMTPNALPGFNIGLRVVIGIAVVIGFLVIFQSMYTAVMERTREIGILKSMGASRAYIVGIVLRETSVLAVVGIILGIAASFALSAALEARFPTLDFVINVPTSGRPSSLPSSEPSSGHSTRPSRPPAKIPSTLFRTSRTSRPHRVEGDLA
jgi:hypothetical protein